MSTKITIAYGDRYHLYSECFDIDGSVYLELNGVDLEYKVYPGQITVHIPRDVIEAILNHSEQIKERFKAEDWNEVQEPTEWKKGE